MAWSGSGRFHEPLRTVWQDGQSSGVGVPTMADSSLGLVACLRERTPQLRDPQTWSWSAHDIQTLHRMGRAEAAQDAGAPAGRPLRPLVSRRPGPSSQCLLSGGGSYSPASWDRLGPKSTHGAKATGREGEGTFRPLGLAPSLVFPSAQLTWSVAPLPLPLPLPLGCGCGQSWE